MTKDGTFGSKPKGLEVSLKEDMNMTHPQPPWPLPTPLIIIFKLSLECGGLCIVHAPGPRLLCTGLSKRKNSCGTGFSRPVHYAVFSTRVIALDIHWMARIWKTVTKKRGSRSYMHQVWMPPFFSLWLRKVSQSYSCVECTQALKDKLVMKKGFKNGSCHWIIQFGPIKFQWVI